MASCGRTCQRSELGEYDELYELRAGVEQMLAHEQRGGDGWWKGWEMLKAAYAMAPGGMPVTLTNGER